MLAKVGIKDIRHIESEIQKAYNAGYVLWEKAKEDPCQANCQTACESGCLGCQTTCEKSTQCYRCERISQCAKCQTRQTCGNNQEIDTQ